MPRFSEKMKMKINPTKVYAAGTYLKLDELIDTIFSGIRPLISAKAAGESHFRERVIPITVCT